MTSHRWRVVRRGSQVIVNADDAELFTGEDLDAMIDAVEPELDEPTVSSVVLEGDAAAVDEMRPSVVRMIRRLGEMVNRHHKAFTVHL